jgi:ATP/maltotriose-dependent transcriptional regulator MalT/DNA-binding SARP family transcriptional activator
MVQHGNGNQGEMAAGEVGPPLSRPRAETIRRQRLLDLLLENLSRRATIISAPAGFGKTTLLLDCARTVGRPVCWYSLDEGDRSLAALLGKLIASVRQRFPGFGVRLESLLAQVASVEVRDIVAALVGDCAGLEQSFLLVLDDFHHLDEAPPEVAQVLEGWLSRLPGNCHLIIASRTRPRLAVLPLLRARQEIALLDARALAFTCAEVQALFATALRADIPLDDAQYLADAAEGWAAALILLADRSGGPGQRLSLHRLQPSDSLYQYMQQEVWFTMPEELQEMALSCGLLRVAEPDLCRELLDVADIEAKLAYLDEHNLFATGDAAGFRFRGLLQAFLSAKLRTERPSEFEAFHLRAAVIFEGRQRWAEAMYHYLQVRHWDRVLALTDKVGRRMFEEGQWEELAQWLEAIPQEELAAQPKLALWKAKIMPFLNQVDGALQLLASPLRSLEAHGDWLSLVDALVTKGMCLRLKGEYQEAKEALGRARSLLIEHDGPLSLLTEARKELGITYGMDGEFHLAIPELRGVLDLYEAQGDLYNIAHVNDQLGTGLALSGQLSEAATHLERARPRWAKLGNEPRILQTLNNLGNLYYLQGDYGRAEEMFREALQKGAKTESRWTKGYVLQSLGDIQRDRGDFQGALELYRQSLALAQEMDEAYLILLNLDGSANAHRLMGALDGAEAMTRLAAAEAEERGGVYELGLCQLTRGLILRDRGQLHEATACLERAVELLKKGDAKREMARAYFHLAETCYTLRRRRMALEYLEVVARLVEELGYHDFLVVEARRGPLLVQYGAANKLADGFYARLLSQLKAKAPLTEGTSAEEGPSEGRLPHIEAFGFGHLRVCLEGREVSDLEWRSEKSKEMFFFLLSNPQALRKEEIVAALWPDLPPDKTNSVFHSNLYRLRQALYLDCVVKDGGHYRLHPQGRFWYDVQGFQQALQEAEGSAKESEQRLSLLERAKELYRGAFAQDCYTEWVEPLRWQLEEQYLRLLATLTAIYHDSGDCSRSSELCQQILAVDEFNEAAWYSLLQNHIASGEVEAAKFSYRRYAQMLRENLEGAPPEPLQRLMRDLTSAAPTR